MRSLFLLVIISAGTLFALDKAEIQTMVSEIKQEKKAVFDGTKNPFISREGRKVVKPAAPKVYKKRALPQIVIQATYNKRVMIDSRWYKEGDRVYGKRIVYIGDKGIIVTLTNGKRKIITLLNRDENGYKLERKK